MLQQLKDFAAFDFQIYVLERLETGPIGLLQICNRYGGGHAGLDEVRKCGKVRPAAVGGASRIETGVAPTDRNSLARVQASRGRPYGEVSRTGIVPRSGDAAANPARSCNHLK